MRTAGGGGAGTGCSPVLLAATLLVTIQGGHSRTTRPNCAAQEADAMLHFLATGAGGDELEVRALSVALSLRLG